MRERVHATALRLGLILRTYVQSPEKREDTRRVLSELLAEMRAARSPLVPVGQAPSGSVDAEIDRLISLLGALLVVLERLESLEQATAAEKRAEKKLEEVKKDWERLQEEMSALEARAERAEGERRALEARLRIAPVAEAASGADGGEGGHYRLKKEIDRLASSLDQAREERETLKKKLDAATNLATEYQGKMIGARKELESAKSEMERSAAARVEELKKRSQEQVAEVTQTAKERYERRIAMLEREIEDLKAAHARERAEWAQSKRRMEEDVAGAVAAKEALTRRLSSTEPEVAERASAAEEIERLRARRRSSK